MPHPHTGENIASYLFDLFEEYKIVKKIICGITDSAPNMVKALEILAQKLF